MLRIKFTLLTEAPSLKCMRLVDLDMSDTEFTLLGLDLTLK